MRYCFINTYGGYYTSEILMDRFKLDEFRMFDRHMTIWELLQRKGIDHITSPCDTRRMALIKASKEWRYCLTVNPEFFKIRADIQKFEKLFNNIVGIIKEEIKV